MGMQSTTECRAPRVHCIVGCSAPCSVQHQVVQCTGRSAGSAVHHGMQRNAACNARGPAHRGRSALPLLPLTAAGTWLRHMWEHTLPHDGAVFQNCPFGRDPPHPLAL